MARLCRRLGASVDRLLFCKPHFERALLQRVWRGLQARHPVFFLGPFLPLMTSGLIRYRVDMDMKCQLTNNHGLHFPLRSLLLLLPLQHTIKQRICFGGQWIMDVCKERSARSSWLPLGIHLWPSKS